MGYRPSKPTATETISARPFYYSRIRFRCFKVSATYVGGSYLTALFLYPQRGDGVVLVVGVLVGLADILSCYLVRLSNLSRYRVVLT